MKDFRKLNVWEKAHQNTLDIYKITKSFPVEERYGLTSQLRRAAVSVPTNIVEGSSRRTEKDFAYFLQISVGSSSEVEYLILLSKDLEFIDNDDYNKLTEEVVTTRKMLINFTKKLR